MKKLLSLVLALALLCAALPALAEEAAGITCTEPKPGALLISPEDKTPVGDYAYSFAFIGDTQIINRYYSDRFPEIYSWIVENIESKNIKFVFGLGDVTDKNSTAEWLRARKGFPR